jgi:hypothetical protein
MHLPLARKRTNVSFPKPSYRGSMLKGGHAEGIKQGYVGGNTGFYVVAGSSKIANQVIWPFCSSEWTWLPATYLSSPSLFLT